jgi:mannitol-1-/sugar-/sorbitol-6-phosphatase
MTVVLSDLDGVLVDSYTSIMRAWRWWGERNGVERSAVEAVQHGRPSGEIIASLAPYLDAAAESEAIDLRQAGDTDGVVALAGAAELLTTMDPGRLAVVTSCTVPLAIARLRAAGLPAPPVLVTPERLRRGKPDPEGYLLAARELGADPADCVVLEDAPAGVQAGRAAGMHVVALLTTHPAEDLAAAHERVGSVAEWLGLTGAAASRAPSRTRPRPGRGRSRPPRPRGR